MMTTLSGYATRAEQDIQALSMRIGPVRHEEFGNRCVALLHGRSKGLRKIVRALFQKIAYNFRLAVEAGKIQGRGVVPPVPYTQIGPMRYEKLDHGWPIP
jgi:hypothetical protein|tara:strand:- start:649 stop:948 length:300 start_codon:yes stop_codon:yes gene_type:complete